MPAQPVPPIHEVTSAEICDKYNGSPEKCDVAGLYKYTASTNGEIWIDTEWLNGPINADPERGYQYTESSFLIHELTHWLQHSNNAHQENTCGDHVLREREAYAVQNAYELKYEADHRPLGERGNHDPPPDCGQAVIIITFHPAKHTRERTSI